MSLFSPSLRTPVCSSCTRRILASFAPSVSTQWTQQTRHKSSKKRSVQGPDSITVRLNRDLPGYGRKGAYVPISAGHMRNTWSRQSVASYLSPAEAKQLGPRGVSVQRDFLFMADQLVTRGGLSKRRQAQLDAAVRAGGTVTPSPSAAARDVADGEAAEGNKGDKVEEERIRAEELRRRAEGEEAGRRALMVLDRLVPARLDFGRKMVEGSADGELFGSVSVADVVGRIRLLMEDNEEASRIVVTDEDVRFVHLGQGQDGEAGGASDRVKTLGTFAVEIGVKGAEGVVTRTVRVHQVTPQEGDNVFRRVQN